MTALQGKELLDFIKQNPDMTRSQLARGAGYVQVSAKSGKESVDLLGFLDAITEAKGVSLKTGRASRTTRYQTTVHQSGILLVGANYVQEFGTGPDDVFDIVLQKDGILLKLAEKMPDSPRPVKVAPRKTKAQREAEKAAAEAAAQASEGDPASEPPQYAGFVDGDYDEGYEESELIAAGQPVAA